jgi:hypothetical protein
MGKRVRVSGVVGGVLLAGLVTGILYLLWEQSERPRGRDGARASRAMRGGTQQLVSGRQLVSIENSEARMRNGAFVMAQTASMLCELEAMKAANAEQRAAHGVAPFGSADFRDLPRKYGLERETVSVILQGEAAPPPTNRVSPVNRQMRR